MILDFMALGLTFFGGFCTGWFFGYLSSHHDAKRENMELTEKLKACEAESESETST